MKSCSEYIYYKLPGTLLSNSLLGRCGASYRSCLGSKSLQTGVHKYNPVYSYNGGKKYASSYKGVGGGYHSGNLSTSSASFHGPTKYSESIDDKIDETPNCSTCIDNSKHCPGCGSDSTAQNPSTPSTPSTPVQTPKPKVSTPSSASLSPSSGSSYTASSGGTHTASVSVPSGYQYVYWYIAGPGIDGLGLLKQTDTGNGSSTSASFSWSIPSYASGDHVITAYTQLSDGSIVEPSYTVTVGSSSTTSSTSSRYYCPWCGTHYNPNNNNSCETRGGSQDGFPDPE